jgi:cell division protein FtsQ
MTSPTVVTAEPGGPDSRQGTGFARGTGLARGMLFGRGTGFGRGSIPHRRMILTSAALLVVGVILVWLIAFSTVFGVRTVQVTGLHTLSAAQVLKVADVARGAPLIRLDTGAIEHRVEQLPDVASAKVSTSFPSTVRIAVTEQVAVGAVKVTGGYLLVDNTGFQFRTVTARPLVLPVFVLPSGSAARASGEAVATVATALGAALRSQMSSIQAFDPNAITLLLRDGRVVAWGSASDSATKARVLGALLKRPGHQFDLTNPAQPFSR